MESLKTAYYILIKIILKEYRIPRQNVHNMVSGVSWLQSIPHSIIPILFSLSVEFFLIERICQKSTGAHFESRVMDHYNFFLKHFLLVI